MIKPAHSKTPLTLGQYVKFRNGLPLSAPGSLKNMLYRSLGASSVARFWQYWNPIFGYYLGYRVFKPLKPLLPTSLALFLTFVVNGVLHDMVTMIVRGNSAFLFTPWFVFLGLGVIASEAVGLTYGRCSWPTRATINLSYVIVCLLLVFQFGF